MEAAFATTPRRPREGRRVVGKNVHMRVLVRAYGDGKSGNDCKKSKMLFKMEAF